MHRIPEPVALPLRPRTELEEIAMNKMMIVMALMTAPGLQTTLDGLLPLPVLARDELLAPS